MTRKFALLYQYDPSETRPSGAEVADWVAYDNEVRDVGIFVTKPAFTGRHRPKGECSRWFI